jgi:uncharacterized protein (DUF362 family)
MSVFKVYIGRCDEYNPVQIATVVTEALKKIKLKKSIHGKVVIKPNLVMAHPKVAPQAFTRVEVVEGLLQVLKKDSHDITQISIVEKSGLGVCTSTMYRHAGYINLKKNYDIKLCSMEEGAQVRVVLEHGRLHANVTIARELAERDTLIFMPKLKTNVLSHGLSAALKLNIGSIDGKERLYHHHRDLPVKIVDLLEVSNPDLIVTDGIRLAFGGNQMTEHDTHVGAIIVASNAVAHDMVAAKMLNLDPLKIEHIREAIDRGYGPQSFKDIEIIGDYPLSKARKITHTLDSGFQPVHQFKCRFDIQSGVPYCVGGCHGIFLDWLMMIKDRKPKLFDKFPAISVFIGKVTGATHRDRVLLLGDCACASQFQKVRRIYRIKGCPPSHKRIVWDMMIKLFILNPLVRPSLVIDGYIRYPYKKLKGWLINWKYRPL